MARGRAGRECLDDHTAAATWTCRLVVILSIGGFALGHWPGEQFTGARDVVGAGRLGVQAVVSDAPRPRAGGGELYYLDEHGNKQDAELHEEILRDGDHAAAKAVSDKIKARILDEACRKRDQEDG